MTKPFFYHYEYRAAFLAGMAGRLRDQICFEAEEIFQSHTMSTPVSDVSFMLFLNENGPSSIADIARAQDYSHQRVTLRINGLEKLELVKKVADPDDQRRKSIALTAKGNQEMEFMERMYTQTSVAIEDLFNEVGVDLMEKIDEVLSALKRKPLVDRLDGVNSL